MTRCYEGLLTLAKEYYDGNGINEEYTYSSPIQNRGDNLLIEDKDFAVVYNGSVGGTYEVMLKFTEKEVRDHIRRYGIKHAGDTLKGDGCGTIRYHDTTKDSRI